MKEKYLRIFIYIVGLICLYAFLAIRIFPLMNAALAEKMDPETRDFNKYGDLYYYNCISHFKEHFPQPLKKYRLSEKNPSLNEADILTFGDSFFDFSFQKTFPERLSDTLDLKVYSFVTQDPTQANPFCILNHGSFQKSMHPKYVIYETIERNIPVKFGQPYDVACVNKISEKNFYDKTLSFVFKNSAEKLYALLLKRGYFINHLYSFFATMRFDLFGYISPLTSKYRMQESPWLFYSMEYGNEPGCFYYQYSDEELENYADNILKLSKKFKSTYNLDLVFMPIPNKYSIYNHLVNDDHYNNFLPRLSKKLDERNVTYVDLYQEFINSSDTLYFGTDTHWNKKGVDKALNLTLTKLNIDLSMAMNNKSSHVLSLAYKNKYYRSL
jgi:hypothetical protein